MKVSVVIATLNRPVLLDRCLAALSRQTLPPTAYEVVVVDDGPHRATEAVVRSWSGRNPGFEVAYRCSGQAHGPAAARNVGWHAGRYPIIAFTDDDCVPEPGWLAAGLQMFLRPEVGAVSGRILVPLPRKPTDWERNVAGLERAPCATANCFYRKTILEALGGFDERFTEAWREDSDLQFRALAHGVTLQRQNRFNALLYKKHPDLYNCFNPHEPPWNYYVTVGLMLFGGIAALYGAVPTAMALSVCWLIMASAFCVRRLMGATHRPSHVAEMIITSLIIPPYAVYWRLHGALKYRVAFF
jgi:glycosyltransferase involved in cell wall biosynthesis